jgi:stearoyl-CoA desaturase (delta-9 desaturase)
MIIDLSERVASEGAKPMLDEPVPRYTLVDLGMVVAVPFLALLAAVPVAWGWGLSWPDVAIALVAPTWCPASA